MYYAFSSCFKRSVISRKRTLGKEFGLPFPQKNSIFALKKTMRKLSFLLFFLLSLFSFSTTFAQEKLIEIREQKIDFGEVTEGIAVEKTFEIVNWSEQPLIIHDIVTTCGCTVPEWKKDPVKKGERAFIKVRFDTNGRTGRQNKSVTLLTNAVEPKIALLLTGIVLPKP
jgi:LEA14-like dessication related protein